MADKKPKKESPKTDAPSSDKHVVKSVRDYNLSPRTRKAILWSAGIFLIIGLFYAWYSVQEKADGEQADKTGQEVWYAVQARFADANSYSKPKLAKADCILHRADIAYFKMSCKTEFGEEVIFERNGAEGEKGRWWQPNDPKDQGTFLIRKNTPFSYTADAWGRDGQYIDIDFFSSKCKECVIKF